MSMIVPWIRGRIQGRIQGRIRGRIQGRIQGRIRDFFAPPAKLFFPIGGSGGRRPLLNTYGPWRVGLGAEPPN